MNFPPLLHAGGTGYFDEIILGIEALLALLVVIYFMCSRSASKKKPPPPDEQSKVKEPENTTRP
jgi:hypothetical protein